jgi:hypothetical protein
MDLVKEISGLPPAEQEQYIALLLFLRKQGVSVEDLVAAAAAAPAGTDLKAFMVQRLKQVPNAEELLTADSDALFAQAREQGLGVFQALSEPGAVEQIKQEASDVAPEIVDEALDTAQRLSAVIPSRRRLAQSIDMQGDADLIEKASELKSLDRQKALYDASYRAGTFAQKMAGQQPTTYGFAPAVAPEGLSAADLAEEKGRLLRQLTDLQQARARLVQSANQSDREKERSRREVYQTLLKQQEERLSNLSTSQLAKHKDIRDRFEDKDKEIDTAMGEFDLARNPKSGIIEAAARKYAGTSDGPTRLNELKKTFDSLAGNQVAQYLLIKRTADAFGSSNFKGTWSAVPGYAVDQTDFTTTGRSLGISDEAALKAAFNTYSEKGRRISELKTEQIELRKQMDEIVWPGVASFYADKLRTAESWFKSTYAPEGGFTTIEAPANAESADAASYVGSVYPGAVLAGSDVKLPSGEVVAYSDFAADFPSAEFNPATQSIVPAVPASRFLEETIEQTQDALSDLDDPQLSEMDERKQDIMQDPRFDMYMEKNGYTDRDKAFEYFKSDYALRKRLASPATDRQKRDAALVSGQAMGTLPQRIGAVARTALGPPGRQRRQRRRQAVLSLLSPGVKKSRITEDDAATATTTQPAPETAPPQAAASPPPAPEPALPTVWTDAGKYATYAVDKDGNLTMTKDGKTSTIDPVKQKKAHAAIMAARTVANGIEFPEPSEFDDATRSAVGQAMLDEDEASGAPTALPRQVLQSEEQFKKELAAIPDAPDDIRVSPLERLRFGQEERGLRVPPLVRFAYEAVEKAKSSGDTPPRWATNTIAGYQQEQDAAGASMRRDAGIAAAEEAIEKARMLDEEPPAWAAATLDSLPLVPQDRGEIQRATTEPEIRGRSEQQNKYLASLPEVEPTGGEGVPLSSSGHVREGIDVAKARTVPVLPRPEPLDDPTRFTEPELVGSGGVPVDPDLQRVYAAGERAMEADNQEQVSSSPSSNDVSVSSDQERKRKRRLLDKVLMRMYEAPAMEGTSSI